MSDVSGETAEPAGWVGLVAVVTVVQAVLSLMSRTLPLLGLPLTAAAGVAPEAVGQLGAATSFGSMAFFLWGPALLARIGALRQLQIGCVVTALALLLCLSQSWAALLLASWVIGLGYGPAAPAGSDLLMRAVPPGRRGTIFSIKQAGVTAGGLAAGLVLPGVALWSGGTGAALGLAGAVALVTAGGLGFWRGPLEGAGRPAGRRGPGWRALAGAPLRMARLAFATPELRLIAAAGMGLGTAQGVLLSYYPVYLSDHAGWSLAAAGLAFAALQGAGIGGRILMGWLTDRSGDVARAMVWLCFASAGTMFLIAGFGPGSPPLWIAAVSVLAGVTVVSWNGVFLTGLAIAAPEGRVGEITSAGTFLLFTGYVASPLAIQGVFHLAGYAGGLVLAGAVPLAAGLALSVGGRRRRR